MSTVLLGIALWAAPAVAGGFPLQADHSEASLLDASPPGADLQNGTWQLTEHGVAFSDAARGWNYWLTTPTVSSGMVRARVTLGERPDFTVLLRASVEPGQPQSLSGYGVSLEHDKLLLYRWDDGIVRQMGAEQSIEGLLDRESVEVVAYLIGPQILATVYDANSLALLGTVAMRDAAFSQGHVGWRVFDKQDAQTTLTHLSVQSPEPVDPDPSLFGAERLVEIASVDASALPEDMLEDIVFEDENQTALLTDPLGVERLVRMGIAPQSQRSEIPFWAVDEAYRQQRGQPPQRTEHGYRLDLSYKDNEMVADILHGYAALYPEWCRVVELGRSGQGRPIWALRISDNPDQDESEPMVLLNGSHHGNELLSVDYALDAVRMLLEEPTSQSWRTELDIWVVPLVNPDGNHMFTQVSRNGGRKNMRDTNQNGILEPWDGVDLNRNYPFRWGALGEVGSKSWRNSGQFRGPSPGSEVETQAMMRLAQAHHPVAVLSWHTNATVILSPYTIDRVENPDPDAAWDVAEAMAAAGGQQPNGRPYRVRRKLYSVDGVDQDWHRFAHGSTAYIIEGSHRRPQDPDIRQASIDGVRPLLTTLLDRILHGPTLSVVVLDEDGQPLQATISIDTVQLNAEEQWSTRSRDGRFDHLLPAFGRYTIRVQHPRYAPTSVTVEITEDVLEPLVVVMTDANP